MTTLSKVVLDHSHGVITIALRLQIRLVPCKGKVLLMNFLANTPQQKAR